ncbi:unnamed protein product [Adineta steineri]|uniref:Uncharacterized protein n=1 Tax=Adineta steineri TaxID=433720 RepID=A0A815U6P8_9BILA|nr:unnamed protein product [Adineta steineri]CAF1261584.1 unnamed protein product [Adineta steineri]CAF1518215.1 unnamed protein product [Adineta steineri]CAF3506926.1 unnamed protein product [Adineta steineri]CAF3593520.1 unnamed protein product [Adineta steineri]
MQENNSSINGGEIVIAKFNYNSQESHELTIVKNERLVLLDDTCLWWKVKRVDSDDTGYIPSNFARREKRSLLDKIISKRIGKKQILTNVYNNERIISSALVKFRYDAESEDEISLNKGIWVNVLQKKADGWWLVQYEKQRGWFPSNYLMERTSDSFNSLSLLNQLNNQHNSPSSLSFNGLSSSSSGNSNVIENQNQQQIRHNSHPLHITKSNDDYAFVIKPSKLAHSDGRLDTCNNNNNTNTNNLNDEQKMNSCSALIQQKSSPSSSTMINEKFQTLTLNNSPYMNEIWYYGLISRDEAEKYLKLYGNEQGDFLIRDSERRIGNYSLSIRDDADIIRHFRIELSTDGNRYIIGKRSFKSLYELIEHYKTHPVYDADQNNKLYLNKPLIITDVDHQL